MRVDPHYPPIFLFYKGLAQFAQGRYPEAAKAFEEAVRVNPDAPWVELFLAAAYGQSGRDKDAAATAAAYSATRVRQGGVPFVMIELQGNVAQLWFKFPERSRLVDGLRAAGVPYNFDSDAFKGQRLNEREIDALAFGHRLRGRNFIGEEHGASISADGSTAMAYGDWSVGTGAARIDGERLCFVYPATEFCGIILRNPGGTRAKENEYILFGGWGFPFSQIQ